MKKEEKRRKYKNHLTIIIVFLLIFSTVSIGVASENVFSQEGISQESKVNGESVDSEKVNSDHEEMDSISPSQNEIQENSSYPPKDWMEVGNYFEYEVNFTSLESNNGFYLEQHFLITDINLTTETIKFSVTIITEYNNESTQRQFNVTYDIHTREDLKNNGEEIKEETYGWLWITREEIHNGTMYIFDKEIEVNEDPLFIEFNLYSSESYNSTVYFDENDYMVKEAEDHFTFDGEEYKAVTQRKNNGSMSLNDGYDSSYNRKSERTEWRNIERDISRGVKNKERLNPSKSSNQEPLPQASSGVSYSGLFDSDMDYDPIETGLGYAQLDLLYASEYAEEKKQAASTMASGGFGHHVIFTETEHFGPSEPFSAHEGPGVYEVNVLGWYEGEAYLDTNPWWWTGDSWVGLYAEYTVSVFHEVDGFVGSESFEIWNEAGTGEWEDSFEDIGYMRGPKVILEDEDPNYYFKTRIYTEQLSGAHGVAYSESEMELHYDYDFAEVRRDDGPAEFVLDDWYLNPAQVESDETVTIMGEVTNIGGEEDSDWIGLYIDDMWVDSEHITLAPGESKTVTFTGRPGPDWDVWDAGFYDVKVTPWSYPDERKMAFEVIDPAEFLLLGWTIDPPTTRSDETVTIKGQVWNAGGEEDSDWIDLYVDDMDTWVDFEQITLAPGETKTVTFSGVPEDDWGIEEPIAYNVKVTPWSFLDDWESEFEIYFFENFEEEEFPPSGWHADNEWYRTTDDDFSGGASARIDWDWDEQVEFIYTPWLELGEDPVMYFWERSHWVDWYDDHHYVVVYDGEWSGGLLPDADENWRRWKMNLDQWAEENVRLGFLYWGEDGTNWYVDHITVYPSNPGPEEENTADGSRYEFEGGEIEITISERTIKRDIVYPMTVKEQRDVKVDPEITTTTL